MIRLHGLLAAGIGLTVAAGVQVRDRARLAPASISGRVLVAGAPQQPARRVRVTLNDVDHVLPGQTVTTQEDGTFVFAAVPAGRFDVQAFRNGYLRASYGAARPDRPGTPVVVKGGETVRNLVMTIARGGVITGVVRDARGIPVPGLDVRVLKLGYNAVTGEPTLASPATAVVGPTDDRGEYRAFGLPPGGYVVLVNPSRLVGVPGGRGGELRQLNSPVPVTVAPVFHPGVTDVAAAATIPLALSEERTGIDVSIQLVPTSTVSGRITSPTESLPPMLSVALVPAGPRASLLAAAGLRSTSAQPHGDGTFQITGVTPGTYTLKAYVGRGRGAPGNVPTLSASADIVINGQDLDVPLMLQPGVGITGRVVFEGSQPSAAQLQSLAIGLIALGSSGAADSSGGGHVDANGRFTFAGVAPDTYRFTEAWGEPAAGERWTLKSSVLNGRDVWDTPLRLTPGEPAEWTLVYTDTPSVLEGSLRDGSGGAVTDASVLVFPADRAYWIAGSRRIRMARPATDATYRVRGLPAGDYFVAAFTDLEPGEWNDPTVLAQASQDALRITLRNGATTRQDLTIQR